MLPSEYFIKANYDLTIETLIAESQLRFAPSKATTKTFPCAQHGKVYREILLLSFNLELNDDILRVLMAGRGLRPANLQELLTLWLTYPEIELSPIVALGSPDFEYVPILFGKERRLHLTGTIGWWGPHQCFAATPIKYWLGEQ